MPHSKKIDTKQISGVLLILLSLMFAGSCSTTKQLAYEVPTVNQHPTFSLQGFNMCAWNKDHWSADMPVDEGLRFAVDEGANSLALSYCVINFRIYALNC